MYASQYQVYLRSIWSRPQSRKQETTQGQKFTCLSEPRDQSLILWNWQGPRERVPPLPQIMTSTLPLGEMVNQRTRQVQCGPLT